MKLSQYINLKFNTGLRCYQKEFTATILCGATIEGAKDATLFSPTGSALATKAIENGKVEFDISNVLWGKTYTVGVGDKKDSVKIFDLGMTYDFTIPRSITLLALHEIPI